MSAAIAQEVARLSGVTQWVGRAWRRACGHARTVWRAESIWLGPGAQALARRPHVTADDVAMAMPDLNDMLSAWRGWCEANPGKRCELAVSGHCFFTLVWPDAGREAQDRIDAAREAWAQATGMSSAQLGDDVVWRALSGDGPSLVCGLPRRVLHELMGVASLHGVRVERLVPWWVASAQAWSQGALTADGDAGRWVASEPGLRTVWQRQEGADPTVPAWAVWSERQDVAGALGNDPGIDFLRCTGVDADTCLVRGWQPGGRGKP